MNNYERLALTQEDISAQIKKRNFVLIIIGAFAGISSLFIFVIVYDFLIIKSIMLLGSAAMHAFAAFVVYWLVKKDIDAGFKYCVRGKVQSKIATPGKSRTTYIVVNNEKFVVIEKDYQSIEIGDEIEAHFSAHTRISLFFKKCETF